MLWCHLRHWRLTHERSRHRRYDDGWRMDAGTHDSMRHLVGLPFRESRIARSLTETGIQGTRRGDKGLLLSDNAGVQRVCRLLIAGQRMLSVVNVVRFTDQVIGQIGELVLKFGAVVLTLDWAKVDRHTIFLKSKIIMQRLNLEYNTIEAYQRRAFNNRAEPSRAEQSRSEQCRTKSMSKNIIITIIILKLFFPSSWVDSSKLKSWPIQQFIWVNSSRWKSIFWYSANVWVSIRVSDWRLYSSTVDLTGNVSMIEKLLLGGTWIGDLPIFSPMW